MEDSVAATEAVCLSDPSLSNTSFFKEKAAEFHNVLNMEEIFWRQKASCRWNLEGDRNTKLFHNMVKRKRVKGKILSIEHEGRVLCDPVAIHDSAVSYFESVLADNIAITEEPVMDDFPLFIHDEINEALCEVPLLEEVRAIVFHLNRDASAVPDGYTAQFYQS